MSTVYVTRRVTFNAAHRLHNPAQSDAWNADTYGKCNNLNWHGHNYVLHVTVAGEPNPDTGYVIDLGTLREIVDARVVDHLDHRNLNLEVDFLRGVIPSTENVIVAIWRELEAAIPPPGRLHALRLYETENNWVDYFGA